MRTQKTEGIIIKRKNLGDSDRIITVFTKNNGKVQLIAKGVRKINSRRAPHVELLNLSALTIYNGKIPVITEAQTIEAFSGVKSNLKKSGHAFYVCELVNGLLAEHQENRRVFQLVEQTLRKLQTDLECSVVIAEFEKELLDLLGFWPKNKELGPYVIENIMERKIKTKRILHHFS